MYNLRKDWDKLNKVKELLEDGPMDYLDEEEVEVMENLLDKIELVIRDELKDLMIQIT
jgi:hypothetical protein